MKTPSGVLQPTRSSAPLRSFGCPVSRSSSRTRSGAGATGTGRGIPRVVASERRTSSKEFFLFSRIDIASAFIPGPAEMFFGKQRISA